MGGPLRGRDEVRGFFERLFDEVGHNEVEIAELEVREDTVVASVYLHGTMRATGLSGAIPAVHVFTVRDDLIAENRAFHTGD